MGVSNTAATTTTSSKKKKKKATAQPTQYIPGLTPRPVSPPPSATTQANTPKNIPASLIEAFLNGSKNPVSAVMEYCSMQRRTAKFQEVSVEVPSYTASFACQCTIDGTKFPQGTGKTKKEAKTNCAKIAFTQILGLQEDDVDDDGMCNLCSNPVNYPLVPLSAPVYPLLPIWLQNQAKML